MTDLDALLAEAFEQRAAAATTAPLSAPVMRDAIRQHKIRTARRAGVGAVCAVVVGAGVFAIVHRSEDASTSPGHGHSSSVTVGPDPNVTGSVVASLPWSDGATVQWRVGAGGYTALCLGGCVSPADPTPGGINLNLQGLYGLAPEQTSSVTVQIGSAAPVNAEVDHSSPMPDASTVEPSTLFATPNLTNVMAGKSALTRDVTVIARDHEGRVLATSTTTGSWDLARLHSPAGPVVAIPKVLRPDHTQLLWIATDGWTCIGDKATLDHQTTYGAQQCALPGPSPITRVTSFSSANSAVHLLRVPATVAHVRLTEPDGRTIKGTVTDTGHGGLAILRTGGEAVDKEILTCTDGSGRVVYSGPIDAVPAAAQVTYADSPTAAG